ncbi:MAG: accessory factor UbiK family protein [Pseudomonadota bacterium]|nr:accessory factor UbiK family protein [Pseudomonadota bacterium]
MAGGNRILEDAARVAGGALETIAGLRREAEGIVQHRIDKILSGMDLVTRDEFDAVKEMAATARMDNERLAIRLAELEKNLSKPIRKKAPKSRKTPSKSSDSKKS